MTYATTPTVRERILAALAYQIAQITEGGGYKTTILTVVIGLDRRKDISEWPAVIIRPGIERVVNESYSDDLQHKEMDAVLLCMPSPSVVTHAGAVEFQNNVLADIEKLIGENSTLPDPSGNETCFVARVMGAAPFERIEGQTFPGIAVNVKIRYRQEIKDPTVSG